MIKDYINGIKCIKKNKLEFIGIKRNKTIIGAGYLSEPMDFHFGCYIEQNGVCMDFGFFYLWWRFK